MKLKSYFIKYSLASYFVSTFILSWIGALSIAAPTLLRGGRVSKMQGLLMFPVMIIGPAAAGIVCTFFTGGIQSLKNLFGRLRKWKVPFKWYCVALFTAPVLLTGILYFLKFFVATSFAPHFFFIGILFGIPAGIFEEIGWTGFATPEMLSRYGSAGTGIRLGFTWGLWHLPAIDFLGAATPHGHYLVQFALSFIFAMAAMRVIIVWIYNHTQSILLTQLAHIISTGSLVVLGPAAVSPAQESLWYFVYAVILWLLAIAIIILDHKT